MPTSPPEGDVAGLVRDLRTVAERGYTIRGQSSAAALMTRAADRIDRLTAEREALREALEPFAEIAEVLDEVGFEDPKDRRIQVVQSYGCGLADLTDDEFNAARAALGRGEGGV